MSSWQKSEKYANMPHDQYLQTEEGQRYTKSANDWQQWLVANAPASNSPDYRPTQGGGQPQGGGGPFGQPAYSGGQKGGYPSSGGQSPTSPYFNRGPRVIGPYSQPQGGNTPQPQSSQPPSSANYRGSGMGAGPNMTYEGLVNEGYHPDYAKRVMAGEMNPKPQQGGQQGRPFVQPFYGSGQQGSQPASAPSKPVQFAAALPVQWGVDPDDSTRMINVADWAKKSRGGNNGGGQQGNILSPSGQPNYGGGQPQGGQSNYGGGNTRASSPFRQQYEQAQLRFGGQSNYTPPQQQYRPPAQYTPPAQQYSPPQPMSGNSYGQNYGQNYSQQTPAPSRPPSAQDQFRQSEQQRQQAGLDRGQQQRGGEPRTAGGFGQVPRGYGQVPRGYGGYYGNSGNARPIGT